MDNQHPSSEKEKVQRLSLRGVLNNKEALIIWETPSVQNKTYVYELKSLEKGEIQYIGITKNPKTRLSHHITRRNKQVTHKNNWIKKVLSETDTLVMTVKESFNSVESAILREEDLINTIVKLTNYELKPTLPNEKTCYILDTYINKTICFDSLTAASQYLKCSMSALKVNRRIKRRYLFNYCKDFSQILKKLRTIKARKGTVERFFISQRHAAFTLDCSHNLINLCLMRQRKSAKGWLISKINQEYITYENNHYKKVICQSDGNLFNTCKEAAIFYKVDASGVSKCCKGKIKTVKGLVFNYLE